MEIAWALMSPPSTFRTCPFLITAILRCPPTFVVPSGAAKAKSGAGQAFDPSMVLLDNVVQVIHLPQR